MIGSFPIIFGGALAGLVTTVANSPPTFNVAPTCKAAAAVNHTMGLSVSQDYQSCMKDEQEARQELVQSWSKFSRQDQARCAGQTQMNAMPSYVEILECLRVTTNYQVPTTENRPQPAPTTENRPQPEAKPDEAAGRATDESSRTIESLKASLASSGRKAAESERETAQLKANVTSLKEQLATSTTALAQSEQKNSELERALQEAQQRTRDAENQLYYAAQAAVPKSELTDAGPPFWQVLAYAAIGGLILVLAGNALLLGLRWAKRRRAAGATADRFEEMLSNAVFPGWRV